MTIAPVEDARTVWVEVLTTQQIVGLGFRHALEIAPGPLTITTSGPADAEPDVVLFDVIKLHEEDGDDLDYWVKDHCLDRDRIDRTLRPDLGARARERGVEWGIDLGITVEDLATIIQEAISGTLLEAAPSPRSGRAAGTPGRRTVSALARPPSWRGSSRGSPTRRSPTSCT